jgi:hypothetical protein
LLEEDPDVPLTELAAKPAEEPLELAAESLPPEEALELPAEGDVLMEGLEPSLEGEPDALPEETELPEGPPAADVLPPVAAPPGLVEATDPELASDDPGLGIAPEPPPVPHAGATDAAMSAARIA